MKYDARCIMIEYCRLICPENKYCHEGTVEPVECYPAPLFKLLWLVVACPEGNHKLIYKSDE
jgi:hypothetical protein